MCLSAVAALAYALLYSDWDAGFRLQGEVWVPMEEARNALGTRYIDWSITVPLLVVELLAVCSVAGARARNLRFTTMGAAFLMILLQPNLSTAGSIIIVSIVMVLAAGAKWRHLGLMGAGGAVLAAYYAWSEPYRRERLLSLRDPFAKLSDEGYQLSQSAHKPDGRVARVSRSG